MDPVLIALLLAAFIGATYVAAAYNHLVMVRHNVAKAWSNIDVLLKQRHDELPKLVEVCRRHMTYEGAVLERLTRLRTAAGAARERGDVAALGRVEAALRDTVGAVLARAESYPQLKAERSYAQLARRIAELETAIGDRRTFYNDSVQIHNVAIGEFPRNLLARAFAFGPRRVLEFEAAELAARPLEFGRG